jgi:hypothetical protein
MSDLYLAVDTGGSQTKAIFQLNTDRPQAFTMPPEIEKISADRLDQYFDRQGWIGSPSPQQRAWVKWDDQVFVLGDFAHKFTPEDRIKERKYENTLYKVLAVVGCIVAGRSELIKSNRKLRLSLAVLLPWNEYSDRDLFQETLTLMLQSFSFQKLRIKVKLDLLMCRPEGGGLAASLIRQQGLDWMREQRLGVLMLGHRNTTSLYFHYGELQTGDSPLLGFSTMLDRIIELIGGLERDVLAVTLAQSMRTPPFQDHILGQGWKKRTLSFPNWKTLDALQPLAFSKDPTLRTKEVEKLAQAIQQAEEEYWLRLERWLDRVLPNTLNLHQVLVGGGAFLFLRPRLEQHFNSCLHFSDFRSGHLQQYKPMNEDAQRPSTVINPYPELQKMVETFLQFSGSDQGNSSLILRFVDCFGLFDYLIAKTV